MDDPVGFMDDINFIAILFRIKLFPAMYLKCHEGLFRAFGLCRTKQEHIAQSLGCFNSLICSFTDIIGKIGNIKYMYTILRLFCL